VDAGKGNNVTKIETTRASGKPQDLINYAYKQTPSGIWYVSEVEHIKHTVGTSEPFVHETIKVLNAEFNIEIPEETFRLDFPEGTKVLDMVLHSSYFVGAPPEPIFEEGASGSPNAADQANQEHETGFTAPDAASDRTPKAVGSARASEGGPRAKVRGRMTRLMLVVPLGVGFALIVLLASICYLRKT
jgi:hypothetical protein